MFILMVVVFVLGYTAIALEHPLKVDKTASALMIGSLTWVIFILGGFDILNLGFSRTWEEFKTSIPAEALSNPIEAKKYIQDFIVHQEILHHLGEISQILFFLLGAMTIVEIIDQ
ncbi:MAG: sodium:proton antiporter, partial [Bacteroidetes bacterium]